MKRASWCIILKLLLHIWFLFKISDTNFHILVWFRLLNGKEMEEPVIDPNYEFEAPQFVDFNIVRLAREDNADIDSWFGKHDILNLTRFLVLFVNG